MSHNSGSGSESTSSPSMDSSYPEQRHAGKIGYGPNFRQSASMMDKLSGLTEEIHGKLAHNPELVKEGHEKRTGELKRRKALGLDEELDPFGTAQEEKPATPSTRESQSSASTGGSQSLSDSHRSSGEGSSMEPQRMSSQTGAYTSGPAAREQAATVAPPESSESDTARLAHARSQGVQSLSEAQERPQ
ncbi:hypothetical protein NP233_g9264 [Leucocoprinus birnbaumii]|uniref:Uncharacterized protein n=1 Tax=Leucocoprinus birnbaumii TaxID=56174 RepID=A0AAD5VKS4_9AGAR|nr:hypothetical protein NP233_g9264 [Leucocoprinus birnbaumii]